MTLLNIAGILERAGADPNAAEGSQAWALAQVGEAVEGLTKAAKSFSDLYGHLWDLSDPSGAGFLSPDSVAEYDEAHAQLSAALAPFGDRP